MSAVLFYTLSLTLFLEAWIVFGILTIYLLKWYERAINTDLMITNEEHILAIVGGPFGLVLAVVAICMDQTVEAAIAAKRQLRGQHLLPMAKTVRR